MTDPGQPSIGVEAYGVERSGEGGAFSPAERLICKFLIVEHATDLNLLFGPVKTFTYHAMLLDRYCSEKVVASAWLKPRELLEVLDSRLQVRGGGWLEFQPVDNRLRIFGASTAYGRFHQPSLRRILSADSFFSPFEVVIESF